MDNHHPSQPLLNCEEPPLVVNEQQALVEEEQPVGKDISCLPSEILTIIFCYLDVASNVRAARVCHRWRQMVRHKSIWPNVQVEVQVEGSNLSHCSISRSRYPHVSSFAPSELRIPHWLPHLTNMSFNMLNNNQKPSTIACVHDLALRYPNIVSLTFEFNKHDSKLADASMGVIRDHLKSLKHLYLAGISGITDAGIARLAGWNSQDDGFPQLLSLGLYFCVNLTDQSFLYLSNGQRSLQHLLIRYLNNITNTSLEYLSQMPRLVQLWVESCFGLNGAGFEHLKQIETLKELHLNLIFENDAWLSHLGDGGSKITMLRIGKWYSGSFVNIRELDGNLASFVHLEILMLACRRISDSAVSRLTTTRIRILIFESCQGITADSLKHLARMTHLRELVFYNCGIDDDGLANLADGRSGITRLAITSGMSTPLNLQVPIVTDMGMKHLARLAGLTKLCLWHCDDVTDEGLAYLHQDVARITDLCVVHRSDLTRPIFLNTFGLDHEWRKLITHQQRLRKAIDIFRMDRLGVIHNEVKPVSYRLVYVH